MDFSLDKLADRPPIESRTSDGLEVLIEISFQYLFLHNQSAEREYLHVVQKIRITVQNGTGEHGS